MDLLKRIMGGDKEETAQAAAGTRRSPLNPRT